MMIGPFTAQPDAFWDEMGEFCVPEHIRRSREILGFEELVRRMQQQDGSTRITPECVRVRAAMLMGKG